MLISIKPLFKLESLNLGYCPHTVTVYNRATIEGLIYLYSEYYQLLLSGGSTQPKLLKILPACQADPGVGCRYPSVGATCIVARSL